MQASDILARACAVLASFSMIFLSVLSVLLLCHSESIEIPEARKFNAGLSCVLSTVLYGGVLYLCFAYIKKKTKWETSGRRDGGRRRRYYFGGDGSAAVCSWRWWRRTWHGLTVGDGAQEELRDGSRGGCSLMRGAADRWNEHLSDVTNADDELSLGDPDDHSAGSSGSSEGAARAYRGRSRGSGVSSLAGKSAPSGGGRRAAASSATPHLELRPLIHQDTSGKRDGVARKDGAVVIGVSNRARREHRSARRERRRETDAGGEGHWRELSRSGTSGGSSSSNSRSERRRRDRPGGSGGAGDHGPGSNESSSSVSKTGSSGSRRR